MTSASALLPGPVDRAAFAVWISALLHAHGDRVLRLKAVLDTGSGTPVVLDAVQHVVHPPRHLPAWTGPPTSSLVVISRDLPADHVVAALRDFLHQPGRAPGARGPSTHGLSTGGADPLRRPGGRGSRCSRRTTWGEEVHRRVTTVTSASPGRRAGPPSMGVGRFRSAAERRPCS